MKKHLTSLFFTFIVIAFIGQAGISQTYIWGGPGDKNSEFDGGLNDWTTTGTPDSALWVWEADGAADRGAYFGTRGPIQSPSVSNGAAVFDSDFYDNAGTPGNFGAGIAPAPQVGELISPEFSCVGHSSVWIQFNEYYRNFQSTTTYAVSIDGGDTWIDGHPFNTDVAVNAGIDPATVKLINISDIAANQEHVKIKFIFQANYYFWVIDDVYIIDSPPADPQIVGTWYPANRFNTPKSQIANDSMYFIMDVINKGGADALSMGAKVSLRNIDTEVDYFSDSTTVDLLAGDTIQVVFNSFMPTMNMDTGYYAAVYEIFPDEAATDDGKRYIQYFRVNANQPSEDAVSGYWTFSNTYTVSDANVDGGVSFQGGGAAGPVYDVYNINFYKMADWAENPNISVRATMANVSISMSGDNPNSFPVNMFMFEAADTLDNQLFNWNFLDGIVVDGNESTQLTYIGYAAENVENIEDYELVNVALTSSDDEYDYVELHPNKKYFLASLWPKGTRYYAAYDNTFQGYKRFFYDQRLSLIYLDDGSGARFYTIGNDYGAWQQGLILQFLKKIDATEEELLPDNTVTLNNPVDNELNVNINFDNTIDKATMVLHSIKGDIIDMRTIKNIQKGTQKFLAGNLPAGTYIFTIFTKDKLLSKKFVVQH